MRFFLPVLLSLAAVLPVTAQNENPTPMQAWQYPYEVHHLELADSLRLAYVDEGAGAYTLLFIHGLGSNLQAWQKNIDVLKANYRCIALDLPGYGKSSRGAYPFDMPFFARAVRHFIDHLALENVVLVGHSMGGQIAVHTVLNSPERLAKLLLLAPAGFETFSQEERDWFQNFYTSAVVKATPEDQIIKNFHLNFHQFPDDAQFMIDDRLLLRQSSEYDDYCQMIPRCVQGMLQYPIFDQLPELNLPTLILYGAEDALIPNTYLHPQLTTPQVARAGQERIAGSQLRLLPAAGHFVQWEQAAAVNAAIVEYLQ
ncbi:MAG: alpha/beta fold hydrolase [Bacteroidota bacterium]